MRIFIRDPRDECAYSSGRPDREAVRNFTISPNDNNHPKYPSHAAFWRTAARPNSLTAPAPEHPHPHPHLSKQLATLETAGYIEIRKSFVGKRPRTSAQLTKARRPG
ncbi:MAG TPA: transcriptional regulator [Streptosporangiaceae bacterium]